MKTCLNENYRILMTNCYTLGNRCYNELTKTFSFAGEKSQERNFIDGDLEGMMRWILSETRAYKSILSTRGGLLCVDRRLKHCFGSIEG
jgi:AAA+ ATPase superfamily predicted ATPase